MAYPHRFAAVTSATGEQLDNDFDAAGALVTVFASAAGVNAIILTPAADAPACTAYGLPFPYRFSFVAAGTSSTVVTVAVGALAALPLYLPTGVQANSADLQSGFYYEIAYVASLNSGSGGFQLVSAIPTATATGIGVATARGLSITNNAVTPNTKIDIAASLVALATSTGVPIRASAVAVTLDLTTTGVNGMDTGSRPTSGWVYIYLISNGTLTRSLGTITSPSAGGPALPVGYTYSGYVGAMYCDASQNLLRSKQLGCNSQYVITAATNTATVPVITSGNAGTTTNVGFTLAAFSIVSVVPLTASIINLVASVQWKAGVASNSATVIVAPSLSWSGANNGPFGSNGNIFPISVQQAVTPVAIFSVQAQMQLESTNIYYASSNNLGALGCLGWTDYYSAAA